MPYLRRVAPTPEPLDCRILSAALDLFVENGYHRVSVHEIQKHADVSIGSIYNHFGGKEGVAKALYKHILNEVDELVEDVSHEIASPSEQCKEIIRLLFEYTETRSNIMAFIFHAKHTEFLPNEPVICNASPFIKIRTIIQRAINNGELNGADPWVVSSTVFGGAIRMIQLRLDGLIEKPLPEYYDSIIESAWKGIAGTGGHVGINPELHIQPTLMI